MTGHANLHIWARFKDLDSAASARAQLETKGLTRSHIELGPIGQEVGAWVPQTWPAVLAGAGLGGGIGLLVLAAVLVAYPLPVADVVLAAIALGLGAGLGAAAALVYRCWLRTREGIASEPSPAVLTVRSASRRDAAVAEFMLRGCENVTDVSRHVDPLE